MGTFKRAEISDVAPSVVLVGLPGDGKTYTGLQLATAFAGDGGKVAVIDTERSAAIYSGGNPFEFDVVYLADFAPDKFAEKIAAAEREGYDALLIDCLSDEYISRGGVLDTVHATKNKQQGWGIATPPHSRLISAISNTMIPIVATVGARVDDNGSIKPVQRADMMRAFHVGFDVSPKGLVVAHKTRFESLSLGKRLPRDGAALAPLIIQANTEERQLYRQKQRFIQAMTEMYSDVGYTTMEDVARLLKEAGVAYDADDESAVRATIAAYIQELRNAKPSTPKNGGKASQTALFDVPEPSPDAKAVMQ